MHELAVAQNIVSAVESALEQHGGGRVLRVRLKVGEISGVEVDSLRFCYEATVQDSPLKDSFLDIELAPMQFTCANCGSKFRPEGFSRRCPDCGGERTRMLSGTELEIVDFEVE